MYFDNSFWVFLFIRLVLFLVRLLVVRWLSWVMDIGVVDSIRLCLFICIVMKFSGWGRLIWLIRLCV